MSTFNAAHIASCAHLFATETRRVCRIEQRQLCFIQDFIHVQARQWYLSSGYEIKIFFVVFIEIISKLWQLTRAEHSRCSDHKRKIFFSIALPNVKVEHERNQGALQSRARTIQHIET